MSLVDLLDPLQRNSILFLDLDQPRLLVLTVGPALQLLLKSLPHPLNDLLGLPDNNLNLFLYGHENIPGMPIRNIDCCGGISTGGRVLASELGEGVCLGL